MWFFLTVLLVIFLLWPYLKGPATRWFSGFMARRTEDMMRRMMGMPTRKEQRRQQKKAAARTSDSRFQRRNRSKKAGPNLRRTAELMRAIAVDVEFVEIKEFSTATIVDETGNKTRIIIEEQISDVVFTEIKL